MKFMLEENSSELICNPVSCSFINFPNNLAGDHIYYMQLVAKT
jgi:hypothetical protein